MTELVDLIAASMATGGNGAVEKAVFGTDDARFIAREVERWCEVELGSRLAEPVFYEVSVGCVIGIRLVDGSARVIKVYQPRWTAEFLAGVATVQAHLSAAGFPCPRPIAGPLQLAAAVAMVESLLADPGPATPDASMLPISATGLAALVELCRGLDGYALRGHPLDSETGRLYPEPHSPIFDFDATTRGAEWIDELATEAQRVRATDAGPLVIAHTDWAARNVRMNRERLLAVYDWDSVALVTEPTAVGQAAATWRSRGTPGETVATLNEIVAFIHHYERARGARFSQDERRAIGGAAAWVLAYAARCEHAIDPQAHVEHGSRRRLAADGRQLLNLAELLD